MQKIQNQRFLRLKAYSALICTLLFITLYSATTYYSKTYADASSFTFPFEENLPFVPWLIIPYLSSGIFFGLMFFWCQSERILRLYTKRFIFVTVVAATIFLLFPLKNTFVRPELDHIAVKIFDKLLEYFDSPYNQAPSLHVTYAVLYWTVLKLRFSGYLKVIIAIWLLLMIVSTVFVYQHHIIDVISGLLLGLISILVIKK